jgi:hypothetical protein
MDRAPICVFASNRADKHKAMEGSMKPANTFRPGHVEFLFGSLVLALCGQSVISQTSIGFRDPMNIKPVLDYRLPGLGIQDAVGGFFI